MLLVCAYVACDGIWVLRGVDNERIPFPVKLGVYIILFLIGQFDIYLLC